MQATIKLAGGARLIQVEGETQKDLFEGMAMAYEVFNETNCGLCGSNNIRPVVRVVDKFRFYEYVCQEPGCFAKLTFGQAQEGGGLFPKRKLLENGKPDLAEGTYGDHHGWTKYRGEAQHDETQPRPQSDGWPRDERQSSHSQHSSLPPAPAHTTLRNLLGDMGVSENEGPFREEIVKFLTRGPKQTTYQACLKSTETAQHALERMNAAIKHYGSGAELIVQVQKWISQGAKKA